jgi:tRNA1Val (adenine37-N6)-methyltransferase
MTASNHTEIGNKPFKFKQFVIEQDRCSMKVGTDGVLLGAWAPVPDAGSALDIGTGTGVIAIMLAQRSTQTTIHAVEIDSDAYQQTCGNILRSPWQHRLQAFHLSVQEFAKNSPVNYDLIVSNPPFFSGGTLSGSQDKASVRHTVKLPHGDLLSAARTLLAADGKFCVILPKMEGLRFREIANSYHLYCTRVTEVISRPGKPVERLLLMFEKKVRPLEKDQLIIHGEAQDEEWSADYRQLTGDFYLKF